jgi:hypothetical protein
LVRWPASTVVVATWAVVVVPTGMPLRSPDMSSDVRLGAVSSETAGSDGSEPLAKGLSGPLGNCVAIGAAATAAYVFPPFGDLGCRPSEEACLLVVYSSQGAGWQAPRSHWPARWLSASLLTSVVMRWCHSSE